MSASLSTSSLFDLPRVLTPFFSEVQLRLVLLRDTSERLQVFPVHQPDLELDPRAESSRRREVEDSLEVSRYKLEAIVTDIDHRQKLLLP